MVGLNVFCFRFNLLNFRIEGVLKPQEKVRDLDVICDVKWQNVMMVKCVHFIFLG